MHKHIILNNGLPMPIVGFGTWMLKGEAGKRAVLDALAVATASSIRPICTITKPWSPGRGRERSAPGGYLHYDEALSDPGRL